MKQGLGTRIIVSLVANAIALALAAALLDKMTVSKTWFILLVAIFSAVSLIVGPVVQSIAQKREGLAAAAVGLIATYLELLITDLVSDSLQIEGFLTWILATVIVWLATMAVQVVSSGVLTRRSPSGSR